MSADIGNPVLVMEDRAPLNDIAVVLVDQTASQQIGDRAERTRAAVTDAVVPLLDLASRPVRRASRSRSWRVVSFSRSACVAGSAGAGTAEDIMAGVESLLQRGVITRFGPLFNIEHLGGAFSLCALQVPEERFDEITELVNACPQVAHNYQRDHRWNMWFVLAAETRRELEATFGDIVARSGCPGLNLPKEEEFYVGLRLTA